MPRIPLCLPKPGENEIADEIRRRRDPRDLTSLDGVLLNNPKIAAGWNSLLGAIRSENSLPAKIRELLILRVAALNSASYEWIEHEKVGRAAGLSTSQLRKIRETIQPIDDEEDQSNSVLSHLERAALSFADAMTHGLEVSDEVLNRLKNQLLDLDGCSAGIDQMIFDATATVAGYNMVSRVLFTLDVADDGRASVPLPGLETKYQRLQMDDGTELHVRIQAVPNPDSPRPCLMFCNSLLTNHTMWDLITPSLCERYDLICFDQRGHGKSAVPSEPCEIDRLADDVAEIVKQLKMTTPVHGLIGVSQGGAIALSVSVRHPKLFSRLVICDTQPESPPGNQETWENRIKLAESEPNGLNCLANSTIKRWFPIESHLNQFNQPIRSFLFKIIQTVSIQGFKSSSHSLFNYSINQSLIGIHNKILICSGQRDGKIPMILENLFKVLKSKNRNVEFCIIEGAGHLPCIDQPLRFLNAIQPFLS